MIEALQTERTSRKHITGIVTSRSGDKTIKVTYFYKIPHPIYKKEIKRKTVLHAHDETNVSKLKRWRVIRVVEAAPIA
jgi:small subunit ribosomal protein S17